MIRTALLVALSGLLLACAGDEAVLLGPQEWDDTRFIVESRPSPIRQGMTEFIVIATRDKSRPGVGFVVSLRASEDRDWRQAIQDGYTGVYRRAVWVEDPLGGRLAVHVKKKDGAETTLYFPFPAAAGAN
ncbi:MAG TPA: hypothetical protein ENK51_04505 [Gammaproteobacteria bacterium]|nr:hypothetical protein [Gammaproteobacteria bacterium]